MPTSHRPTLNRERIVSGALDLADHLGMAQFTIRRLADAIETKPMTIYHHLPNKEAIVDAMVDAVFAEIALPPDEVPWREAMVVRCSSMRTALARHPWAAALMETRRNPGPATLRHHDAVIGCLRRGGLSLQLTAHAYAVIDAFLYGFALQEAALQVASESDLGELAGSIAERLPADRYPHLLELTVDHAMQPGYDFAQEFDFGLALVLDGLERAADAER